MSDINKYIGNEVDDLDKADRLRELGEWNEGIAAAHATEEGIVLQDEHWAVVNFLRDDYINEGAKTARTLTELLEEKFEGRGGIKYLYTLFPNGPVNQGSRIAGIPLPKGSTDPSFGSVR
jgi:tRNA 2-thiouridine synthesizing protein E